jgi:hypothetical protein
MIKNLTKGIITLSLFALLLVPVFALNAQAPDGWYTNMGDKDLYLDEDLSPREAAVGLINLVLSFLGLVAVVIVLIGGFKWMTAGGNEEKVGSAKKLLIGGLIGLVIVLLAWGISSWVLQTIPEISQQQSEI